MKTTNLIKKIILVILLSVLCKNSFSQGITWSKILNFTNGSTLFKAQQTSDGGYIAVGTDRIGIYYKIFIVRVNQYGDSIWSRHYDLKMKSDYISYWIQETHDKGFIISGLGEGPNGDAYLLKLDSLGSINWIRIFSTAALDQGFCVKELPDKGFIFLNRRAPFPNNYIVLTRTDSIGDVLWTKQYGDFHLGLEVDYIENSGFIVAGWKRFEQENLTRLYLLRTDLDGDTIWTKLFYEFRLTGAYSIDVTEDKGFIIGGVVDTSDNFLRKAYVVKTDSLGNIQWQRRYANGYNETCYSIRKFGNARYVMCGFSDSLNNSYERGVIRIIDISGNILNEEYFRYGGQEDVFYSVERTNDNGFILSGNSTTFNNVFALLIKTDSTGNIYPVNINYSGKSIPDFQLHQNFPNPFNSETIISFDLSKDSHMKLIIYDIRGKEVSLISIGYKKSGSYSVKFSADNLASGIYFYKLMSEKNATVRRMVILK